MNFEYTKETFGGGDGGSARASDLGWEPNGYAPFVIGVGGVPFLLEEMPCNRDGGTTAWVYKSRGGQVVTVLND